MKTADGYDLPEKPAQPTPQLPKGGPLAGPLPDPKAPFVPNPILANATANATFAVLLKALEAHEKRPVTAAPARSLTPHTQRKSVRRRRNAIARKQRRR